jgi:flagellar biosynthesis/type III secretory pathway M-ring protein FliF/YscJ
MKHRNTLITVAIIAAVLLAAYGIGLLIRQARIRHLREEAAARDEAMAQKMLTQQLPGGRRPRQDDQKRRAEIQKQREMALEKVKSMTDEQKRKMVQDEVRRRTSAGERVREAPNAQRPNVPAQPGAAPAAVEPNKTTDVVR